MESEQRTQLIYLGLIVSLAMLAFTLISIFLPNFYLASGLSINQIALLWFVTFVIASGLPLVVLKFFPKYFEKMLMLSFVFGMLFLAALVFAKNPVLLGILNGLFFLTFWPAFNLMLFRLTGTKERSFIIGFVLIALPSLVSIAAPAIGVAAIEFFGFNSLFALAGGVLAIAFVLSLKLKYEPAQYDFALPKGQWPMFALLGITTILFGFSEVHRIVYPLFIKFFSNGFLNMGILATVLTAIIVVMSLVVGKIAETKGHRILFAALNMILFPISLLVLAFAANFYHLAAASVITGIGGAFSIMLFSLFGDFFDRRHHATLIAVRENFLMIGRMANLVPVVVFMNAAPYNFSGYFWTVGLLSLTAIIPFGLMYWLNNKKGVAADSRQA